MAQTVEDLEDIQQSRPGIAAIGPRIAALSRYRLAALRLGFATAIVVAEQIQQSCIGLCGGKQERAHGKHHHHSHFHFGFSLFLKVDQQRRYEPFQFNTTDIPRHAMADPLPTTTAALTALVCLGNMVKGTGQAIKSKSRKEGDYEKENW